jgi:threonine dehydrogenase-like Zn-dependent dehydrogenase
MLYLRFGSQQIAGHEFAGTREDGTPVAVEAIFGCGACEFCEQGNFQYCHTLMETALGLSAPGGMSEYFRAPERVLTPLPTGLSVSDACLVEPASVAWHGCHNGKVGPDTSVAVVGAGAIGILAAAAAQEMHAASVDVEARHAHQHEARERLGAGIPTSGYDVVIETGGSESSLHRAVELVRPGGTLITIGVFIGIEWPMNEISTKEVALRPSLGYCAHNGRREFAEVADMLASRPELPEMLISKRFPLEDAPAAYAAAQDRSKGIFRVVVEP